MAMKSRLCDDSWWVVRKLLENGHTPKTISNIYRSHRLTVAMIHGKNSEEWHIPLKVGRSRGPFCPRCKKRKPVYRQRLCHDCFLDMDHELHPLKGRPSGDRHPQWRGGKTKTAKFIRFTPEYKAWRKSVFERDGYRCVSCGVRGCIQAHHIKSQAEFPELRFDVSNGVTLCRTCHGKTPNYGSNANSGSVFVSPDDITLSLRGETFAEIARKRSEEIVLCACGCGVTRRRFSKAGIERRYISGHNRRKR